MPYGREGGPSWWKITGPRMKKIIIRSFNYRKITSSWHFFLILKVACWDEMKKQKVCILFKTIKDSVGFAASVTSELVCFTNLIILPTRQLKSLLNVRLSLCIHRINIFLQIWHGSCYSVAIYIWWPILV